MKREMLLLETDLDLYCASRRNQPTRMYQQVVKAWFKNTDLVGECNEVFPHEERKTDETHVLGGNRQYWRFTLTNDFNLQQ